MIEGRPHGHNARLMPWQSYKRYLPTRDSFRTHPIFGRISYILLAEDLWHLNRRAVGGAFFIGLFCAFLPLPIQSPIAVVLALLSRCNLPISIGLVWVTNPLTMGPMFFFAYKLGIWLLGADSQVSHVELSWIWIETQFTAIWWPLLIGSLICGWVSGLSGMLAARIVWRMHIVRRWQNRQKSR